MKQEVSPSEQSGALPDICWEYTGPESLEGQGRPPEDAEAGIRLERVAGGGLDMEKSGWTPWVKRRAVQEEAFRVTRSWNFVPPTEARKGWEGCSFRGRDNELGFGTGRDRSNPSTRGGRGPALLAQYLRLLGVFV